MIINQQLREAGTAQIGQINSGSNGTNAMSMAAGEPISDGVQLSRLGGVLNAFQTNADRSSNRIDHLASLFQDQAYSIDSIELSRKLMGDMLQKQ